MSDAVALEAMQEALAELEAENLELRAQLAIHAKANCAGKLGRARAELRYLRQLEGLIRADLQRVARIDREAADARGKTFVVLTALDSMRIRQASEPKDEEKLVTPSPTTHEKG